MLADLFSGALVKVLTIVAILATSVAVSATYLYLGTRDELASLQSTYRQLKQDYTECSEAKDRVRISAEQDDTIILDKQEKINSLTKEKDDLLTQLGKIPKKACKKEVHPQTNIKGEVNEVEYVDIDAPFDPVYQRVFEQLSNKD